MTKTTMLEPICYANVVDIERYKESPRVNRRIPGAYDVPLYTKDQAEAYAAAKVREALEEAARVPREYAEMLDSGLFSKRYPEQLTAIFNASTNMAERIRALIPKDSKS